MPIMNPGTGGGGSGAASNASLALSASSALATQASAGYALNSIVAVVLPDDAPIEWWKVRTRDGGDSALAGAIVFFNDTTAKLWARIG